MPPTKIFVATIANEFQIVTVTNRRAIDREVLEPNFVRRLLVVPRKRWERRHPCLRFTGILAGAVVPQSKQSTFDLDHAAHVLNRWRRSFHRRVKLITKQMLDVIDEQFLMLHLVFKPEPQDRLNFFTIAAIGKGLDELRHLLIYVGPVFLRLG